MVASIRCSSLGPVFCHKNHYPRRKGALYYNLNPPPPSSLRWIGAKAVLGQVSLEGKIVVADALLTQREVCQQVVGGGGDYLLPVKENQPTLHRDLADAFFPLETKGGKGPTVPFWQAREWRQRGATLTVFVDDSPKQRHGRWERRELWALADPELNRCHGLGVPRLASFLRRRVPQVQ